MSERALFHLAFPVKDVQSTVAFYRDKLNFKIDLIEENRCIIKFFGHQLVAHVSPEDVPPQKPSMYPRHFGVILDSEKDFMILYDRAKSAEAIFFQEYFFRFEKTKRAHKSFFLIDNSNNLLEFKWYVHPELIFSEEK